MERSTKKFTDGTFYCEDIEYVGIEGINTPTYVGKAVNKLADYEDAEEQGLILRPKCRLGSDVYALWSVPSKEKYVVYQAEVKEINLSSTNVRKMLMYKLEPIAFRGRYNKYYDDDLGKLVFMSQEEAEKALAERKNDEQGYFDTVYQREK